VAYSAQCGLYAAADSRGTITIRSLPGDKEIRTIATGSISGRELAFSPDDQFLLAFEEGQPLRVWHLADGRLALRAELVGCHGHAFSPNGRRLAVGQKGWVLCFDLQSGEEVQRWRLPAVAHTLAFHPQSDRLAVGYLKSDIASIFDATSGRSLAELPVGAMEAQVVAWHPDGERLAVVGSVPQIQIWNVAAKRELLALEGHAQIVTQLAFHPQGELLVSHGWDGMVMLWNTSSGQRLIQFASVSSPQFSRDGHWLSLTRSDERADLLEVIPAPEYRTLARSIRVGDGGRSSVDIGPDGRLLAVSIGEETQVWDLPSGREIGSMPPGTHSAFFDISAQVDNSSDPLDISGWRLLTTGSAGLLSWPATSDDPNGRRLRLGPPQTLSRLREAAFARGPDRHTLAAATDTGAATKILDLESGTVVRVVGPHPAGMVQALSSDGRWAASCGWVSDRVRLWNATSGQLVHEWVLGKRTRVFFTPDSRILIISRGDEFSFWDVDTLQPVRRLRRDVAQFPGWVAFSPDGRLMALEMAPAAIHLKEVATCRTIAKLEDPHGDRATAQCFTPDGTKLVVVGAYARAIHVWDLRMIRNQLKEMNIDWDWPAFPPAATSNQGALPTTIELVAAASTPIALTPEERAQQNITHFRRELEANPNSALACNNLAWTYLTAPGALCDVKAAVPLAEKAVRLDPRAAALRNTLGLAYYRAGRYREAVDLLQPNIRSEGPNWLPFDLFLLAMSYYRLGETTRARDYYDWAVRWIERDLHLGAVQQQELTAFRAETEQLLGINDSKADPQKPR
jgi:WD40 repeat protein